MLGKLAVVKTLTSAIRFLLYSNIFIGVCAVALVFTNQLTVGLPLVFDVTCLFVFAATVFTYSALKFRHSEEDSAVTEHRNWAIRNRLLATVVTWGSAVVAALAFFFLPVGSQLITAALGLFTLFYGFIEIPLPGGKKALRQYGRAKTFFVALVWSVTTVLIPLAGIPQLFNVVHLWLLVFLLLRRFLFVAALTMVFDIKDMEADKQVKLYTLPMALGVEGTKRLAYLFLCLLVLINTLQYFIIPSSTIGNMLAINLSLLLSAICIKVVKEDTREDWYYLVLDGMMFTQFLLVLASYHLWL